MTTTIARFQKGNLLLVDEVNERLPSVTDGLIAHFPMDGRGGTFDMISGNQPVQNTLKGVNLIEVMNMDWKDPTSWVDNHGMSWDEGKQALKIVDYHNTWLKTPIVVDTNKHYQISIDVMEEVQSSTGLYLGGLANNAAGQRVTTNYDYSYGSNAQPATGVWTTYRVTRYGTGVVSNGTSQTFDTIRGWTGDNVNVTDKLTKYYYYGGLFNYNSGGVMYIRNLSIVITDDDNSNCTLTDSGISVEEATTNLCTSTDFSSGWWKSGSITTFDVVDSLFIDGTTVKALRAQYSGSGDGHFGWNFNFTGTAGKYFTLSYWVRCDSDNVAMHGGGCFLQELGGSYRSLGALNTSPFNIYWTKITISGIAPSDCIDNLRVILRPANNTTDYVYYTQPQIEQKPFATSFINGSRANGLLMFNITLPSDFTIAAYKKHVLDSSEFHYAITKSANTFTFYKNGTVTNEFKNNWTRYKVTGVGKANITWSISSYTMPSEKGLTTDPPSYSTNLSTYNAGVFWRTFIYASSAVTVWHRYSADNSGGIRVNNGTPQNLGGWQSNTNLTNPDIRIDLVVGWNIVELWYMDGDTGGGLGLVKNSQGSNLTGDPAIVPGFVDSIPLSQIPQVVYMTAECPIEMYGSNICFNEKSNVSVRDLSIYNRVLTTDEIIKLNNISLSIDKLGSLTNDIEEGLNLGDGKDGALTITDLNTNINHYTYVTSSIQYGDTVVNIENGLGTASPGDEILIIQMQNGKKLNEFDIDKFEAGVSGWPNTYGGTVLQSGVLDAFSSFRNHVYRQTGNCRFGNINGTDIGTLYNGKTYTFSIYLRWVVGGTNQTSMAFDICDRVTSVNYSGSLESNLTTEWKRFWVTATHDNSATYHFIDLGHSGDVGVFEWCCPQIVEGSLPGPFVKDFAGDVGIYEFNRIESITSTTINLMYPASTNYGSGITNDYYTRVTQIVTVPNYSSITINSGASLICPTWDGTKGGILAFRCTGDVINNGTIDVTGKGYRGGRVSGQDGYNGTYGTDGECGEGYTGRGDSGGYNGHQPIPKDGGGTTYVNGCGGSYAVLGAYSDPYGGIQSYPGLIYGHESLQQIYLGSGGGGGHNNSNGTPHGGNGGGIIIIFAKSVSGSILSKGQDAYFVTTTGSWGAGGGSGGTIYIECENSTALTDISGGLKNKGSNSAGNGGNGGLGRVRIWFREGIDKEMSIKKDKIMIRSNLFEDQIL